MLQQTVSILVSKTTVNSSCNPLIKIMTHLPHSQKYLILTWALGLLGSAWLFYIILNRSGTQSNKTAPDLDLPDWVKCGLEQCKGPRVLGLTVKTSSCKWQWSKVKPLWPAFTKWFLPRKSHSTSWWSNCSPETGESISENVCGSRKKTETEKDLYKFNRHAIHSSFVPNKSKTNKQSNGDQYVGISGLL